MARKPRIHRPGAFYHVMLRGNNSQPIFFSDADRCKMSVLLEQGIERFCHRIHGYCFMDNHIHLILQAGEIPISHAMQHLAFNYTRYINRKEQRAGHLFQGRFKAIIIDDRAYLLELVRYVHLNPVRANISKRPEDYLWSGHRVYLGLQTVPWLSQEWILEQFNSHRDTAQKRYEQFVLLGIREQPNTDLLKRGSHEGRFLGTDEFVTRILSESHKTVMNPHSYTLQELIDIVCEVLQSPPTVIHSRGKIRTATQVRAMAAFFVKQTPHLTLQALADFIGRDISTLSKQALAIESLMKTNDEVKQAGTAINHQLNQLQIAKLQA